VPYYSMIAGPLLAIIMPSLISKLMIINTLNVFLLFPYHLPFYFKLRFKLLCNFSYDDFMGKLFKYCFNVNNIDGMSNFPNSEFNFQRIYSLKMLVPTLLILIMLSGYYFAKKHPKFG
jgi:hypothetical protein